MLYSALIPAAALQGSAEGFSMCLEGCPERPKCSFTLRCGEMTGSIENTQLEQDLDMSCS